jgi:hypothetical protein
VTRGRSGLASRSFEASYCTVSGVPVTSTSTVQDHFPPLDYLEFDPRHGGGLGAGPGTAEQPGIGYAGRGLMKGYVAATVRLLPARLRATSG